MKQDSWKSWDYDNAYGEVFYKRATGELDEMESAKAVCQLVSQFYQPGMTLVDVGCGAGHYLRSLRTRLDPDIVYTGIDATPYYIELARKAFPQKARFQVGSIYDLPVEDEAYDIVVSSNVLLHLPPPPTKPLEELIRISKKYVVIRTLVGQSNYIIKEIRPTREGRQARAFRPERELVAAEENLEFFNYYNMYTADYFRDAIAAIDSSIQVQVLKDTMWQPFDDKAFATQTGTKVVGNMQIAGNLIMDWHFLVLTKKYEEK